MTAKTIKAAVEKTYGKGALVNGINEVFAGRWCRAGRRYNSYRAILHGLQGLTDCTHVNLSITDQYGVGHNADFAMVEFAQ